MTTALAKHDTTLKGLLESRKDSIASVLPAHLKAHVDRMLKVVLVSVNKTPKLQQCSQVSVLEAVMNAAELGLDCGGQLGQAYLVPYKNTCQLIVGYRGLVELARRSGMVSGIEVHEVYEGEDFELSFTQGGPSLKHDPDLDKTPDASKLRGCYVITRLRDKGAEPEIVWMNKAQIEHVRQSSSAGNAGPWKDHYIEMAKKTVIRRAAKMWPLSPEMQRAFEIDDAAMGGYEVVSEQPALSPGTTVVPSQPFGFGASGGSASQGEAEAESTASSTPTAQPRMTALTSLVSSQAGVLDMDVCGDLLRRWMKKSKVTQKGLLDDAVYEEVRVQVIEQDWSEYMV